MVVTAEVCLEETMGLTWEYSDELGCSEESSDDSEHPAAPGYLRIYPEGSSEEDCKATFRRIIEQGGISARENAVDGLKRHLVKIVNKAKGSDAVFVCKNGATVYASSALCMERSQVLDSKFREGTRTSTSAMINVHVSRFHSQTMLAIAEFLYTGSVARHRPCDWSMGLEVIKAAEFFALPDMVGIVEDILSHYVEAAGDNLQKAAAMLSTAVDLGCARMESVRRLVHILRWEWMGGDHVSRLSEEALELLLIRTETLGSRNTHPENPCLSEYVRFRGVLKWATRSNNLATNDAAEKLFDEIIPVARDKLYQMKPSDTGAMTLQWLPDYNVSSRTNGLLHILQSQ